MTQKNDFEETAGENIEAPEKKEFEVHVIYDIDDTYELINVNLTGKGHGRYNLLAIESATPFFFTVSPKKIGTEETVKMKLFPHVNGVVAFPEGWRTANIVEFAYACLKTVDFEDCQKKFFVGIVGKKTFFKTNWRIPMLVLRTGSRRTYNSEFQNGVLAYGVKKETKYVFPAPIYFLGVKNHEINS